jgi:hypothetical protein
MPRGVCKMPVANDDIVLGWDVKCASRGKALKSGMRKMRCPRADDDIVLGWDVKYASRGKATGSSMLRN